MKKKIEYPNMIKTFEGVVPFVKRLTTQSQSIDNWIFKLHYRVTFTFLMVSTILVCSRQYIGEHIHCIADGGVPANVMDTYCFFTTTFTLVKDLDSRLVDKGYIPHPGVGSYGINSTDQVKHHAYYQWVPFVLFGQAIMFYLTHLLWKKLEDGRIKYLVDGLELAAFSLEDKNLKISSKNIPTKQEKEKKIEIIRKAFIDRLYISGSWSLNLVFCESLNFFNVILQIYITNEFLSGQFLHLGSDVWKRGLESSVDPLDEVFPKVTKCTFYKYGPSGSIQWHDAMCIMALNVINDKIYTFLWFWFVILFILTALGLIWRLLTVLLHAKSKAFNKMVFAYTCPGKINPWDVLTVSRYCSYTDWLFLKYLAKNLDGLVFREIIIGLAEELVEENNSEQAKRPFLSNSSTDDEELKID
ncbi:innexin inx7 [Euwallacea similis]|uniref:innexin inx7 n=1 Tax=Euwallacea similis TaxID=1736056 RepID=UPI00344C9019